MMCVLHPLRTDPPPSVGVYTCRHSQKGTRSPRANDRALPVGLQGRVGRANGALSRLRPRWNILYVRSLVDARGCRAHLPLVDVVLSSDQFLR